MIAGVVGLLLGLVKAGIRRRDTVVVDRPGVVRRTYDEPVA